MEPAPINDESEFNVSQSLTKNKGTDNLVQRVMSMSLSRVIIINAKCIGAVKNITPEEAYDLARLKRHACLYTTEAIQSSLDDTAASLSKILYGDEYGPLIEVACLRLDIANHIASGLVIVKSKETDSPLITYAMTHRLHKRQSCMTVLIKLALSALKMNGYNSCSVVVNERNAAAVSFFTSCGFQFAEE